MNCERQRHGNLIHAVGAHKYSNFPEFSIKATLHVRILNLCYKSLIIIFVILKKVNNYVFPRPST